MNGLKVLTIALMIFLLSCQKESVKIKNYHQIQLNCDNNIIALANYTDENGVNHTNKTVDKKVFTVDFNEEFEIKSTTIIQNKFVLIDLTVNVILDSVTTNNYFFKN